jgi:hypothetical protein
MRGERHEMASARRASSPFHAGFQRSRELPNAAPNLIDVHRGKPELQSLSFHASAV